MKFKILIILLFALIGNAQKNPTLIIDGLAISFESNTSLPYWINEGKTIDLGVHAISVSILEFNVVENELQFNQVINLTSSSAVPTSKVWKIEAIGIGLNTDDSGLATNGFSTSDSPTIFTSPQTFTSSATWTVPPGVTNICIEAWGKGGDGGDCLNSSQLNYNVYAGAGGGGSYGYDCFIVESGTILNISINTIGSSVNNLILAEAGGNGENWNISNPYVTGTNGLGGSSTATYNINGETGTGPIGGNGGNGGNGGLASNTGTSTTEKQGEFPGGGGGAGHAANGGYKYPPRYGGEGGGGQIKIYF